MYGVFATWDVDNNDWSIKPYSTVARAHRGKQFGTLMCSIKDPRILPRKQTLNVPIGYDNITVTDILSKATRLFHSQLLYNLRLRILQ